MVRLTCQEGRWHYLLVILICLGALIKIPSGRNSKSEVISLMFVIMFKSIDISYIKRIKSG